MYPFVKEQLQKCKVAQIPEFNDDTTHLVIKKPSNIVLRENNCYLIEIDDYLINLHDNSALVINWNNNDMPKYKYYKVDVIKVMAQMVKINGIAFNKNTNQDINEMWSGWLPLNNIKVLEEL